jgi:hypothetical protein
MKSKNILVVDHPSIGLVDSAPQKDGEKATFQSMFHFIRPDIDVNQARVNMVCSALHGRRAANRATPAPLPVTVRAGVQTFSEIRHERQDALPAVKTLCGVPSVQGQKTTGDIH